MRPARRDFRLLWLGETTSALGTSVANVALPLVAVVVLDADTFTVGVLAAAGWLPWLLIGLPAGAWVDRLPRRPVMLVADLVALVLFASIPVAAWLDVLTIGHLLAVALLAGVASVFITTAYRVYLPALVGRDQLLDANAKLQGSEAAAKVAGPGVAGLIAETVGAVVGMLVDAVSFLVSAVCLLAIRGREPKREARSERRSLRHEIAQGLRFVAGDRYLRVLVCYAAASNVALTGYQSIQVVFLVREVGIDEGTIGVLLAAVSLGGVTGAALAGRIARRFGTARGFMLCELCAAPFALLIPLTGPGWGLLFLVAGAGTVGLGVVASNVISSSFRQLYCPPELLGRAVAGMTFVGYGSIPVGALLGGTLGSLLGTRPTMWIMAALLVATGLILVLSPLRSRRDFPQAAPQPAPALV